MSAAQVLGDALVGVLLGTAMFGIVTYHRLSRGAWVMSDVGRMMMGLMSAGAILAGWWLVSVLFGSDWPGWDLVRFLVVAAVTGVFANVVRVMIGSFREARGRKGDSHGNRR